MWLKKIKKKKFQYSLVALMLCFTSAIFAACICFVAEVSNYTDDYTSYENCPRMVAMELTNLFYYEGKQMKTAVNDVYFIEDISGFIHPLKLLEGSGDAPGFI